MSMLCSYATCADVCVHYVINCVGVSCGKGGPVMPWPDQPVRLLHPCSVEYAI